ncbi:hypothetical protein F5888DRAFT_1637580 [Russula emetica]|nr:hypothetical protein F5888DRAFT_1637580 [Russula emetica]
MSDPAASATGPLASATTSTSSHSPNKSNVAVIIVSCVGGFLFLVAVVLVLVPFARRRASKRLVKPSKSSTSSGGTSSTVHSRRDVHNRTISADASAPLLEPDSNTNTEYSPFKSVTAQSDVTTPLTALHSPNTDILRFPRRFAPSFRSYSARPSSPDLESGPSRSFVSPPQPPLRHARTRIAHTPMDPLPEDTIPDASPKRGPSPTATSIESHAPSPTSWLHIPKTSGIPLIGAFRGSISSLTSSGSSSLPTMQHYPSFTRNAKSVSASSRSSQTFYSVASDGHPTRNLGPQETAEQRELLSPPPGSEARLKPSGVGERIPRVHLNPSDGFHASRQASMVCSNKSSVLSAPGVLRPDENTRPLSGTVGSGSSLSVYSDARSHLGAIGEDGRLNGSVGGSSGGARGRRS